MIFVHALVYIYIDVTISNFIAIAQLVNHAIIYVGPVHFGPTIN